MGQRLTASGTTRLRAVHVPEEDVVFTDEVEPENPWRGSWAQLYLAAVQAGIAARTLDDAVRVVRETARPIKHSTASTSTEDPYVQETVGQIATRAQAARAVVLLAAEELGAVTGLTGPVARTAGAAAAVAVAQAGAAAIEASLAASESALRRRWRLAHRPSPRPGPALAQRPDGREPQPAPVEARRRWCLPPHRTGAAHDRSVLSIRPAPPYERNSVTIEVNRVLGRTGVRLGPLTLGTMNFGRFQEEDESIRIIGAALDAGIVSIDTADTYAHGGSEEIIGKAVKGRRDDIFLATKFHGLMSDNPLHGGNSRRWIVQEVENSLRRLGTDRIDLYQAHRPDSRTSLLETLYALNDLIRQGKILYYGTSTFSRTSRWRRTGSPRSTA